MEMIFCPNCQKLTGYKRAIGFGTFFAVLLTAGFWLLAIPFYPKRCITCGLTKSDSVPWYRTWRLAFAIVAAVAAFGLVVAALFPSVPNRPAPIIHGPDYDKPAAPTASGAPPKTSSALIPLRQPVLGRIIPAGEIPSGEQNLKPPLNVTVVSEGRTNVANGGFALAAQARFSDASLKAGRATGLPPTMEAFRLGLMCGGSRPGCVPLQEGNTYWLQFIHRGDAGFYYDSFRAEDCNLARLGTELGGEASAGVLRMCRRFHGLENGADVLGCWPGVTFGPVYDRKIFLRPVTFILLADFNLV